MLRTILLQRQLADEQANNQTLRNALSGFDARERELERAIEAADTPEARSAVESAVTAFETERRSAQDAVTASDERMADLQRQLDEAEARQQSAQHADAAQQRLYVALESMELREAIEFQRTGRHTYKNAASMLRSAVTSASTGVIGPTGVGGINGAPVVSSLIDMLKITDCTGMSSYKVAYLNADTSDAAAITEGSAPTEGEPTFGSVELTPTNYGTIGYVSKEIRKQSPLLYAKSVEDGARRSLRRKLNSVATTAILASSLNSTLALTGASGAALFDATLLSRIILSYGGDEDLGGVGCLFLNKADLAAFNAVRGKNEYLPVYSIVPDAANPSTGVIKDNNGLSCRYCLSKDVVALSTATLTSTAKKTMFYGVPTNAEVGLWGGFDVEVNDGYKFAEGLLTVRGEVTGDVDVTVKNGFVVVTGKTA